MAHYIWLVARLLPLKYWLLGFIFARTICRHVDPCLTGPPVLCKGACSLFIPAWNTPARVFNCLSAIIPWYMCCNWFPGAVSLGACWASVFFQVYHSSKFISKSVTLHQVYCPSQWIVPWCSWADRLTLSRSDNAAPPCTICTQPLRAIVCRPVLCTYTSTHSLLHCVHSTSAQTHFGPSFERKL